MAALDNSMEGNVVETGGGCREGKGVPIFFIHLTLDIKLKILKKIKEQPKHFIDWKY